MKNLLGKMIFFSKIDEIDFPDDWVVYGPLNYGLNGLYIFFFSREVYSADTLSGKVQQEFKDGYKKLEFIAKICEEKNFEKAVEFMEISNDSHLINYIPVERALDFIENGGKIRSPVYPVRKNNKTCFIVVSAVEFESLTPEKTKAFFSEIYIDKLFGVRSVPELFSSKLLESFITFPELNGAIFKYFFYKKKHFGEDYKILAFVIKKISAQLAGKITKKSPSQFATTKRKPYQFTLKNSNSIESDASESVNYIGQDLYLIRGIKLKVKKNLKEKYISKDDLVRSIRANTRIGKEKIAFYKDKDGIFFAYFPSEFFKDKESLSICEFLNDPKYKKTHSTSKLYISKKIGKLPQLPDASDPPRKKKKKNPYPQPKLEARLLKLNDEILGRCSISEIGKREALKDLWTFPLFNTKRYALFFSRKEYKKSDFVDLVNKVEFSDKFRIFYLAIKIIKEEGIKYSIRKVAVALKNKKKADKYLEKRLLFMVLRRKNIDTKKIKKYVNETTKACYLLLDASLFSGKGSKSLEAFFSDENACFEEAKLKGESPRKIAFSDKNYKESNGGASKLLGKNNDSYLGLHSIDELLKPEMGLPENWMILKDDNWANTYIFSKSKLFSENFKCDKKESYFVHIVGVIKVFESGKIKVKKITPTSTFTNEHKSKFISANDVYESLTKDIGVSNNKSFFFDSKNIYFYKPEFIKQEEVTLKEFLESISSTLSGIKNNNSVMDIGRTSDTESDIEQDMESNAELDMESGMQSNAETLSDTESDEYFMSFY